MTEAAAGMQLIFASPRSSNRGGLYINYIGGQIPLTNGPSRDGSVVYKFSFFLFFLSYCTSAEYYLYPSFTDQQRDRGRKFRKRKRKRKKKLGHHAPAIQSSPERAPHRVDCGCGHRRTFRSSCVEAGWSQCGGIYKYTTPPPFPPHAAIGGMLNCVFSCENSCLSSRNLRTRLGRRSIWARMRRG